MRSASAPIAVIRYTGRPSADILVVPSGSVPAAIPARSGAHATGRPVPTRGALAAGGRPREHDTVAGARSRSRRRRPRRHPRPRGRAPSASAASTRRGRGGGPTRRRRSRRCARARRRARAPRARSRRRRAGARRMEERRAGLHPGRRISMAGRRDPAYGAGRIDPAPTDYGSRFALRGRPRRLRGSAPPARPSVDARSAMLEGVVERGVLPFVVDRRGAVGDDDGVVAGVGGVARRVLDREVRPRAGDDDRLGAEALAGGCRGSCRGRRSCGSSRRCGRRASARVP